jgi:hypothetical protein
MGIGAGLGVAAAGQLVMEHATHDVAKNYLLSLERFSLRAAVGPGGGSVAVDF